MSKNWVQDIHEMHQHYGFHEAMKKLTRAQLVEYLIFRFNFLEEELREGKTAIYGSDPEEIVDALIDLCVVAIGTLDVYGIDSEKAWNEVLKANMAKKVGIKASRPNPLGLPDLVKDKNWIPPSHLGNHGLLAGVYLSNTVHADSSWDDACGRLVNNTERSLRTINAENHST